MLSRLLSVLVVFALVLALPQFGLAQMAPDASSDMGSQTLFGDKFTLKAGYKVWWAKWQAPSSLGNPAGPVQQTADHASVMNGPVLTGIVKLRDSKWFNSGFVSANSLRDGFDFEEIGTGTSRTRNFANRRDTTVTAGLTIWEGFGIFGGYYTSEQDFTNVLISENVTSLAKRTLQGPLFGAFGTTPISERVSVYGNLAVAVLKLKVGPRPPTTTPALFTGTDSASGYVTELGANIQGPRFWKIGTELQVGFRAQIIQKTFGASPSASLPGGAINNDIT